MKIYVACYGNVYAYDSETDQPAIYDMTLEHFSAPQVHNIGANFDEVLNKIKVDSVANLAFHYPEMDLTHYVWSDGDLEKPEIGRPNMVSRFINPIGGEVIISVVIQEMEV